MTVLTKKVVPALFKVLDEAQGIVEQWVSVFGVKDYVNDRVLPGAFEDDLAAWMKSGDPIPVVFSHQWENLDAYVGQVLEAREMKAGDPALPESIREWGALYAKYQFDMEEPSSRKLLKLMKRRIIRQASFAYDVLERQNGKDGANELVKLHLHEVGPCLVGANNLTDTGMVKSQAERKAWVYVPGSFEERQQVVLRAASDWTYAEMRYGCWAYLEATYPDNVIFGVYEWDGESTRYFQAAYAIGTDGEVALDAPAEVEIQATVVTKAREAFRKEGRRNSTSDAERIQEAHDLFAELGAACATAEDPEGDTEGKAAGTEDREVKVTGRAALFEAELQAITA